MQHVNQWGAQFFKKIERKDGSTVLMYVIRGSQPDGSDIVTVGVPPVDVHVPALICEALNMIEAISMQEEPTVSLNIWRHKVRGTRYVHVTDAVRESDLEPMTVYKSVDGDNRVWVRPTSEFMDGRYEYVGEATDGV
jgi:hypothetical protein